MAEARAAVYTAFLAGAELPKAWKRGYQRWLAKPGGKSPLEIKSYRGIVLLSILAKDYERHIDRRLSFVTEVDELQGVANLCVDMRHQIHKIAHELITRDVERRRSWVCTKDIKRAFPSTDKHVVAEIVCEQGVRGDIFRVVMAFITDTAFRPGMRRGVDAPTDVPAGIGVFEGAVLSPRILSLLMGPLTRRLKLAGVGVKFLGYWARALFFTDDIALICDTENLLAEAIGIVLQ